MSELSAILERESQSVDLLPGGFERLLRRRDRKERNRRIANAVVALVLAVVAIGAAIRVLGSAERQLPANRIDRTNVSHLNVAWSGSMEGVPASIEFRSFKLVSPLRPTVAEGHVYVGTTAGKLYAFSASCGGATCRPDWVADLGSPIMDPPSVSGGIVYVASRGGELFAFPSDCGSGGAVCRPLWTADTQRRIDTPVVWGGMVYGLDPVHATLYAFPASCGSGGAICHPLWRQDVGVGRGKGKAGNTQAPTIVDGVLYIAGESSLKDDEQVDRLYAFDARTGDPLWIGVQGGPTGVTSPFDYTPIVADGKVFVVFGNTLHAFPVGCASGGAECPPAWTYTTHDLVMGNPYVSNGVVLVKSWVPSAHIQAFATDCGTGGATCDPIWRAEDNAVDYGLVAGDGYVFDSGVGNGITYAFPLRCANPCQPAWRTEKLGPINNDGVSVSNGVVYVGTQGGRVLAYPTRCRTDGRVCDPLWSYEGPPGGEFPATGSFSPPAIVGGKVFTVTADGKLYAFALPGGGTGPSGSRGGDLVSYVTLAAVVGLVVVFAVRRRGRSRRI